MNDLLSRKLISGLRECGISKQHGKRFYSFRFMDENKKISESSQASIPFFGTILNMKMACTRVHPLQVGKASKEKPSAADEAAKGRLLRRCRPRG
jgi:hypothetical protein